MLCYKNHRFQIGRVSFQIPNEYFLDTEPEMVADNCIHLWDPGKTVSIDVRVENNCGNSQMELAHVLTGMKPVILKPTSIVAVNNMFGYHATYRNSRTQYYEMWLDIEDHVAMCIVIITRNNIEKVDPAAIINAIDPQLEKK